MNDHDRMALQLFSALSDTNRWKILQIISKGSVKSITLIAKALGVSTSAAVNQVALLEKVNLVTRIKRGKYHQIEINHVLWEEIERLNTFYSTRQTRSLSK